MADPLLNEDELTVLRFLSDAWNAYIFLPELHPSDRDEFMRAIHAAQNIVMARPVVAEQNERRKRGEE